MESEISKIGWALVAVNSLDSNEIENHELYEMLKVSFEDDRTFRIMLCGEIVEQIGTLSEMEAAYELLSSEGAINEVNDFFIVSSHEKADLFFMPINESEINEEND